MKDLSGTLSLETAVVKRFFKKLVETKMEYLGPLEDHIRHSRYPEIEKSAHSLKGVCLELRLPSLSGLALAVEDNPISLQLLRLLLEKLGCTVETASNGREAIEKIRHHTFAICLMDPCMPEMEGTEATQEIRKIAGNEFPVIAITASAMKGDEARCLNAGMKDYLSKPIDPVKLREKIARWAKR